MKKISYLGPPGTFSHEAAVNWGRRTGISSFVPCTDLPGVISTVLEGKTDAAILPVENSIEGTVNLTMDLVMEEDELQIIGEVILPIYHCLISMAEKLEDIKEVCSHPQALAQCRKYLANKLPGVRINSTTSTAEAVSQVSKIKDLAAIGSIFAAELYRLPVLEKGIQDYQENKTRFWVIGRERYSFHNVPYKTSLVIAAKANKPGSLYGILRNFAEKNINLTRIESRPTKKELGEYLFYIDCEGNAEEMPLQCVLEDLQRDTALMKVLGTYPMDLGGQFDGRL